MQVTRPSGSDSYQLRYLVPVVQFLRIFFKHYKKFTINLQKKDLDPH